jgi:hypothetical protein
MGEQTNKQKKASGKNKNNKQQKENEGVQR